MPGQRRLHMKKESAARRGAIVDAITSAQLTATVYNAGRFGRHELDAREACLRAMVADAVAAGHHMVVVEQDDSLLRGIDNTWSRSPANSGAGRRCDTSTGGPNRSCCSAFPTRSPGAGPGAADGATGSGHWLRRSEFLGPGSAKPGSPTVRTATGLTS
jgi:hypothetical protein